MKITIDEEQYAGPALPPRVQRALKFLDNLPDGKAMTTRNLAAALGLASIQNFMAMPELAGYQFKMPIRGCRTTVWANLQTMKVIREQYGKD